MEEQWFSVDGVAYRARQEPDLRFLKPYGCVFYVFDGQMSGNLCFGVEGKYGKLFIKYAGARTLNYTGRIEDAVYSLKAAMPIYAVAHPALIKLLAHGATNEGYAAVFQWRDAPVLRPVPPDPAIADRVRALQAYRKLKMLDMVYDLHACLAEEGYIAVDFTDGNVLIDFDRDEAIVCDIDLYRKKPVFNDRGRMPGSSRFMSPEEYTLGAALDERSTVYAMGALAFEFFGENQNRARENWFGPAALYDAARRATQDSPAARPPSMRAFLDQWRQAVRDSWIL